MKVQKVFLLDNCPWNDDKEMYEVRILDREFWTHVTGFYEPTEEEQVRKSSCLAQFSVSSGAIRGHWLVNYFNGPKI